MYRTTSPSWVADPATRSQHPQAAQYQRLGAAARGGDRELRAKGYMVPEYPEDQTERDKAIRKRCTPSAGQRGGAIAAGQLRPRAKGGQRYAAQNHTRWRNGANSRSRLAHVTATITAEILTLDRARDVKMGC